MKPPPGGEWEPAAEILSRGFCGEGSLRHLGVADKRRSLKEREDDASQLNRLGWLTFIFGYFRFQPNYIGFSSAHNRHFSHLSAAQVLAAVETCFQPSPGSD
jgi:hypothetical protein